MLEQILKDDFVEYREVYRRAAKLGMLKHEVRKEKIVLDVQMLTLVNGDERLYLWYIPKNVWKRFRPLEGGEVKVYDKTRSDG